MMTTTNQRRAYKGVCLGLALGLTAILFYKGLPVYGVILFAGATLISAMVLPKCTR